MQNLVLTPGELYLFDLSFILLTYMYFTSHCFNCGSTEHVVSTCPERFNQELVSLSRAMHQFYHAKELFQRFHESEDWKMTRLRWIEEFKPGEIRGPALREALNMREGDLGKEVPWLHNMLIWGYPKGWAGPKDPKRNMEDRITSFPDSGHNTQLGMLRVFGDVDDVEVLDLDACDALSVISETPTIRSRSPSPEPVEPEHLTRSSEDKSSQPSRSSSSPAFPIRWAKYETDMFLSERLPIYNARPIDDQTSPETRPDSVRMPPRTTELLAPAPIGKPWRDSDAFSAFGPVAWECSYERLLKVRREVDEARQTSVTTQSEEDESSDMDESE